MITYKISVTDLVSFLYASGDLMSERFQNVSMLEGIKAHQYVQSKYQSHDLYEVSISNTLTFEGFQVDLSGRIDGLIQDDTSYIIEEIKSTRSFVFDHNFKENNEHLAQLKIYAYMYMTAHHLKDIKGRIAYIQIDDYAIRYIEFYFDYELLSAFFESSVEAYIKWIIKLNAHHVKKQETIETLIFPFDGFRRGQKEMMAAVYQTLMNQEILYTIAPTGIGKTIASLFAALKTIHHPNQKIFYLTAKTQGKQIALDTLDLLSEAGLHIKVLEITAKDHTCFLEKRNCDPEKCPFAKGFFDRLKDAMIDIFTHENHMSRQVVETYAKKHQVCPFEYALYVSYFVDIIVCDYNYAFDPRAHLVRYFEDLTYKPALLVDEAHNMISRSKDMYSETFSLESLIKLRKLSTQMKPTLKGAIKKVIDYLSHYDEKMVLNAFISDAKLDNHFISLIKNVLEKIERTIKHHFKHPNKSEIMEIYISYLSFIKISELYNDSYVTHIYKQEDQLYITLQCLDASAFILDTITNHVFGTVFFSATMYPLSYYQKLITQGQGETLTIKSPFDPNKLKVCLMRFVSTKYATREKSLPQVMEIIQTVAQSKEGNYIVFFPSYAYMNQVIDALPVQENIHILIQTQAMDQLQKDYIFNKLKHRKNGSNLAFFVMGGIFSEGIDYIGDLLNGVIIIGVGLPMVNDTNNELKAYYEKHFNSGFDYAYTYPGMNKVIQAVGRVIRRHEDYGIAILVDDRFGTQKYQHLFPPEWQYDAYIKNSKQLENILHNFWKTYSP